MESNLKLPLCVVYRHFGQGTTLKVSYLLLFFSKRDEKKDLICRAAVKPEGRSPKSKPNRRSVA
ncbi:MAG: hypothetical protein IJ599_02820 [Alphaproteobacteria bacterium]|nr:hypothetical protein [Alphaproteobacteria bacterium]